VGFLNAIRNRYQMTAREEMEARLAEWAKGRQQRWPEERAEERTPPAQFANLTERQRQVLLWLEEQGKSCYPQGAQVDAGLSKQSDPPQKQSNQRPGLFTREPERVYRESRKPAGLFAGYAAILLSDNALR
jgi:hypothetical protein